MKKLGLVGGTGPESTVLYYREIIAGVGAVLGLQTLPPLSIESLNVFTVMGMCADERFDELTAYLLGAVQRLAAAGAELATLTGNTPHIVFDRLQAVAPIPLISAVEATRDAARDRGLRRLALLGTEFTMTNDFFARPFEQSGIGLAVPTREEIAYIQDKIAAELEHAVVTDETRERFVAIIERLRDEEGVEQVILGCTELPLLLDDDSSPIPCLDTVAVHTRVLVDAIVGG